MQWINGARGVLLSNKKSAGTSNVQLSMNSKTSNLPYHNSLVILFFTLAGQFFSFYREAIFGKYFGTTLYFDAFTLTFSILLFISSLFTIIPFFLIPTLADAHYRDDSLEFTKQLSLTVFTVFIILTIIVSLLEIFAATIISLAAPGFNTHPEILDFSVTLLRISTPVLYLLTISQIFRSVLNLKGVYIIPALESLFFNLGIIGSVVLSRYWLQIKTPLSIVFGYYFSYLLFTFLCIFAYSRLERIRFAWNFDFKTFNKFGISVGYLFLATFLNYLNPLILMSSSSHLSEGAVSSLGYVQRILAFSIGNIVNSVLVVFLPSASLSFISNGQDSLRQETEKTMSIFMTISLFVSAVIILNSETIVRLIYRQGLFNDDSVKLVSQLAYYYIPWIIFFPISNIAVRVLYINKDYKMLTVISALGLAFTIMLVPVLQKALGVNGLGLMASLHMVFYSILLVIYIRSKFFRVGSSRFISNGMADMLLVCIIGLVLFSMKQLLMINTTIYFIFNLIILCPLCLWRINNTTGLLNVYKDKWRDLWGL